LDATHGGNVFNWLKLYLESIEQRKEEELFYYNELMKAYSLLTSTRTFSSNQSLKVDGKKPSLKVDKRRSSSLPPSLPSSSLQEPSSREGYSKATSSNSSSPFHASPFTSPHTVMDSSDTKYRHSLIHDAIVSGNTNLVQKIADLTEYVIQSLNKTRRNLLPDTGDKNTDKNTIQNTDTDMDINLLHPLLNKTSATISGYYDRGLLQYAIYVQSSSLLQRFLSPPWSLNLLVPARLPWEMCRGLSLHGNMLTSLELAASLKIRVGVSNGRDIRGSEYKEGGGREKVDAVVKDLKEEIKNNEDKNGIESTKEAIKEGEKEVKNYESLNEPNEHKQRQLEEVFNIVQKNDKNIKHPIFSIDIIDSYSNYHGNDYYGKNNDELRNKDDTCIRVILSYLIHSSNLEKNNINTHNANGNNIHDISDHNGDYYDSDDYNRNENHLFTIINSAFHLSLSISNDKCAAYILSALIQISKSISNVVISSKNKNDSYILNSILNWRGEMDIGLRNEYITQCSERDCPITLNILLNTFSIKDTTDGDTHSKKDNNNDDISDENSDDDDTYDDDVDSGDFLSSLDTVFDDASSKRCNDNDEIVKRETVLLRDTGQFRMFMYVFCVCHILHLYL
jgi:hypothetical protein